jgi:hypothetical protein
MGRQVEILGRPRAGMGAGKQTQSTLDHRVIGRHALPNVEQHGADRQALPLDEVSQTHQQTD